MIIFQGLKSGGYKFPGSFATIKGINATMKVLDTFNLGRSEDEWRLQIDECMEWFTTNDLDMIAMYFEQVSLEKLQNIQPLSRFTAEWI